MLRDVARRETRDAIGRKPQEGDGRNRVARGAEGRFAEIEVECVLTRRDEERHQTRVGRELNGGGPVVERGPPAGEVELVERDAEIRRRGEGGAVVERIVTGDL